MLPRAQREQLERTMIGSDGVLSVQSKGRARPEPESAYAYRKRP